MTSSALAGAAIAALLSLPGDFDNGNGGADTSADDVGGGGALGDGGTVGTVGAEARGAVGGGARDKPTAIDGDLGEVRVTAGDGVGSCC